MSFDPPAQSYTHASATRWGDPQFEAAVSAQVAALRARRPSRALTLVLGASAVGAALVGASSWRAEKVAREALDARSVATVEAQMALGREVEARSKAEQTLKAKADAYERRIADLEAQVGALKAAGYGTADAPVHAPAAKPTKVLRAAEKRPVSDDPLGGIGNAGRTDGKRRRQ